MTDKEIRELHRSANQNTLRGVMIGCLQLAGFLVCLAIFAKVMGL